MSLVSLWARWRSRRGRGAREPGGRPFVRWLAGAGTDGLRLLGGSSTVEGLVIDRFGQAGIELAGGGHNTIVNNYLGTDPTGTLARGNGLGVLVNGSVANTVGGTSAGARNLIS